MLIFVKYFISLVVPPSDGPMYLMRCVYFTVEECWLRMLVLYITGLDVDKKKTFIQAKGK